MPAQRVTNDEIAAALRVTNSPTQISKMLGITQRALITRLRSMGVPPLPPGRPKTTTPYILNRAQGRIDVTVEDGVVIVGSDAHYMPGTVSTAHRALLKFIRELKPRVVVMNGDVFDGGSISRYPRIGWDKKVSVMDELKAVDARLTEIENVAGPATLVWPMGNHDARYETFLAASAPQYEGVHGFSLKDHFPKWQACWGLWINQDTCPTVVKHRFKGGIHATRNATLNSGVNIITGHLHSLKVAPLTDYNGTRYGVDTGTLADPYDTQFSDYTELNPVDWRSGFVVLTFWKGELLMPELVFVRGEGVVEFRGKVLEV